MIDKKIAKCAHIPCNCDAAPGQQYCGGRLSGCGERRSRDRMPMRSRALPAHGTGWRITRRAEFKPACCGLNVRMGGSQSHGNDSHSNRQNAEPRLRLWR
jgi:hypothetical protein